MPQTSYSNKDLNKPLKVDPSSKTKVYTNKDTYKYLPKDDFEPDDFTADASAQDDFTPDEIGDVGPQQVKGDNYKGPDTFLEGFMASPEAQAMKGGAKGWVKGATIDIPQSIVGGVKSFHDAWNPLAVAKKIVNPIGSMASDYLKTKEQAENIADTISNAGSRPEEFGRIVGQFTGQPLVTEGIIGSVPPVIKGVGAVTEGVGKFTQNFRPVSGSLPTYMARRMARPAERAIGKGIEKVGQKIRAINNKVVGPVESPLKEGQILHPDVETSYRRPLTEGEELPAPSKPKVRLNPDGTYTDLNTGEVFDSKGRPMAEPMIDKDSPFFKRNRKY